MNNKTKYYIILGISVLVFCIALVFVSKLTNDAAGDMLIGLHDAASNAYAQQGGSVPTTQNVQNPYTYPDMQYVPPEQQTAVIPQPSVQQQMPVDPYATQYYAQQPATQMPVTQTPQNTPVAGTVLDVNAGKTQILEAMCMAVNSVKTAQNFGAVKYQNISINLDDCSVPMAVSLVNPIIQNFTGEETLNYQFVNGTCIGPKSGEPVTPNLVIPPSDRLFALDPNGVTAAVVTKNGTETTYSISVVGETATLESPAPYYHAMCMDYLDMNALDLGIAKINSGSYTYPGSTVNVTVNQLGQIIRYEEYMPLSAYGEGTLGFTASGTISGFLHEVWTFTW